MTNEEMERAFGFMVEQQAQFAANLQQVGESVKRIAESQERLWGAQERTTQVVTHLSNVMLEIAEAQARTEAKVEALAEAQARTDVKMAETDERLNALINTVERYISEGRNGKSPQ